MASVILNEVCKVYKGGVKAVKDFNLEIKDGEFIVFVGPSGCGKSTTLRMIAGLEEITSGQIYIDGVLVNDLEPKDRDIAMVFQNYALYPHMNVYDNLSYSLKCHHESKEVIKEKVHAVSKVLGIEEYLERKPKELSGGQRQRVALGRCLIRNPKVFLFDEPLSNLDAKLRVSMRSEISKLHKEVKGTFIYVTHDQTEAMTMADRIVVMKDGVMQQVDTPTNLYEHPSNIFVATFLGSPQMNIFKATLDNDHVTLGEENNLVKITLAKSTMSKLINVDIKNIYVGIRPSDFYLGNENDYDVKVNKIELIEKLGNETLIYFYLPGRKEFTLASLKLSMQEELGDTIYLKINKEKIHLFDDKEESLLKVNELNYLPAKVELINNDALINDKYLFKEINKKLVVDSLTNKNYLIGFDTKFITLSHKDDNEIKFSVKVDSIDLYSDKKVYYAEYNKDGKVSKISFYGNKNDTFKVEDEVNLYVNINNLSLYSLAYERLTTNKELTKPIIELGLKKIKSNCYFLTDNKVFAKNKYFIIKDIFNISKEKMLLNVTNNKNDNFTIKVDKDDNLYVEMCVFIKYRK